MKPHLISFETCPFVQRSVITLLEKGIDFDIEYIDLENKPDWFLEISPFGKVPVLKIGDTVLFESAVINEYLDETNPPALHPKDPLGKAYNRAWIEFASSLNFDMFYWAMASDEEAYTEKYEQMCQNLSKLDAQLGEGPFFNGSDFSLVDAAAAPFMMRLQFIDKALELDTLATLPNTKGWSNTLLKRTSVINSFVPNIEKKFIDYIQAKSQIMGKKIA